MKDFNEFAKSESLRNSIIECIKDAGEFPKTSKETDLSHYILQVAFNVALETVNAYHDWLVPQLKNQPAWLFLVIA